MESLESAITVAVNKFVEEHPDVVIHEWKDFVSWYSRYFNEGTYVLLEPLYTSIPTMWSDIASYGSLPIKYARKYEESILPSQWSYIMGNCETDDDFHWVASHLDELPYWLSNVDHEVYKKFSHLFSSYKIDTK